MSVTVGKKFVYAIPCHLALSKQALERNSYSRHDNSILVPLQMGEKAHYNENYVGSFPSLQQGGTT